jgi:hypothetical protein
MQPRRRLPQLLQARQPSEVLPEARLNSATAYVRLLVSGPRRLAHDASHVQLRDWLLQFREYYDGSYLEDGNIGQQHGYFYACIDRELRAYIPPVGRS